VEDKWASEKVRVYYPVCDEKATLYFIASYGNRSGRSIYCKYSTLALDTGKSVRTIRRHVKTLVLRGDLITWCDLKRSRACNYFYVPIATETVTELEERTGISRKQMKLPLVHELQRLSPVESEVDRAEQLRKSGVKLRPSPKAVVTHPQGHGDPARTLLNQIDEKGGFKKSGNGEGEEEFGMSDETHNIFMKELKKLENSIRVAPVRASLRSFVNIEGEFDIEA
jgi:hypothetical protein